MFWRHIRWKGPVENSAWKLKERREREAAEERDECRAHEWKWVCRQRGAAAFFLPPSPLRTAEMWAADNGMRRWPRREVKSIKNKPQISDDILSRRFPRLKVSNINTPHTLCALPGAITGPSFLCFQCQRESLHWSWRSPTQTVTQIWLVFR